MSGPQGGAVLHIPGVSYYELYLKAAFGTMISNFAPFPGVPAPPENFPVSALTTLLETLNAGQERRYREPY
ncbi:MAG: hypothetical protein WCJ93_10840 [Methanomicrobiales archaeon]